MIDSKGNDKAKAYIATVSGRKFNLLEPKLEDIDIYDIAHGLSLQCRWTGQCKFHYSIAQHSYLCSFVGPDNEAFDRLMHDASEAYIGDMNRPLKHYTAAGAAYMQVESKLQRTIAERFGFSIIEPASVKLADNYLLYAERDQIVGYKFDEAEDWERYKDKGTIVIEQLLPSTAKQMFLNRFEELYSRRIN